VSCLLLAVFGLATPAAPKNSSCSRRRSKSSKARPQQTGQPSQQPSGPALLQKLSPEQLVDAALELAAAARRLKPAQPQPEDNSSSGSGNVNAAAPGTLRLVRQQLEQVAAAAQARCGELSRQQLTDMAWAAAHHSQELALPLEAAMAMPFRVLPAALPALRLEVSWWPWLLLLAAASGSVRACSPLPVAPRRPGRPLPPPAPAPAQDFVPEVALRRDVIYLDGGSRAVEEARLTAWQSDIGATFLYSGKEMVPPPGGLTPSVAAVRDALAALTGVRYDSVLINYYEDGKCGMRYHVDPLYNAWTPRTAVVSLGATRQFVFREMSDHSVRWHYLVSSGDVVVMSGDCQERLQHCVKVEAAAEDAGPRMSLVFKERIPGTLA
jgi:alkylated DNA repair dioxygenase AlkB